MGILKLIAICLYVFGVPAFLVYLLLQRGKRRPRLPGAGRALLGIGGFMAVAILASYVPMLAIASRDGADTFYLEVMALAGWVLPSVGLILIGWILRRP